MNDSEAPDADGASRAIRALSSIAAALLLASLAVPSVAVSQSTFEACVARLRTRAIEAGVQAETADRALAGVRQLERVIREDRNQPEFVATFADYFERRVTPERIETGRRLLAEHRDGLQELTTRYDVPGQYLVALWGLETNYGRMLGDVPVFDSLTTLACDDRRGEYFTVALVDALKIVDRGDMEPERMTGSWAGAMGHTQFMPAAYLAYAVDGDGDGPIDLWSSPLDALASAANYLRTLRWERGVRWGREVQLPEGFDYSAAGLARSRPLREWRALGLRDVDGRPLADLGLYAALLVPSGHEGPAFIVYENFRVLMRWNRSEHFALVVGHLADRIAGAASLRKPPVDGIAVTRDQLLRLQRELASLGYDSGVADGIPGPATRAAIRDYQRDHGLIPDGHLHAELLEALSIN
jgi:membrane-bound lytic murein transglycosylase B